MKVSFFRNFLIGESISHSTPVKELINLQQCYALVVRNEIDKAYSLAMKTQAEDEYSSGELSGLLGLLYEKKRNLSEAFYYYSMAANSFSKSNSSAAFWGYFKAAEMADKLGFLKLSLFFLSKAEIFCVSLVQHAKWCELRLRLSTELRNEHEVFEDIGETLCNVSNFENTHYKDLIITCGNALSFVGCQDLACELLGKSAVLFSSKDFNFYFHLLLARYLSLGVSLKDENIFRKKLDPELALKWQIISSLLSGDLNKSNDLWSKLAQLSPTTYASNYQILKTSERKGLWGEALQIILRQAQSLYLKRLSGNYSLVAEMLIRNPCTKGEIIEKIWKNEKKFDDRFHKLIERIRHKCPLFKIILKNGYYTAHF
jgi:hypothetical protein